MTRGFAPVEEQLELLGRGAVDLVEESQLAEKLARSRESGRPLTVKAGFDPSAPDLHLGHTVLLQKMKQFQDLGHRVVFVIGDFTARIGDPTGKKATRPQLTNEEIAANLATYERQVFRILDRERTVVERNSSWLDALGSAGVVRLAGRYTLARLMERDDFRGRWEANRPIAVYELLYPLLQGYDSIALEADVELGGHDQIFNLLVGRTLMKEEGLEPQVVLTVPLLVGIDGSEKMSKSLGNAVGIQDPPAEIYGRTMSIPDTLMWDWWLLLTDLPADELARQRRGVDAGDIHPKAVKEKLAWSLTERFHGAEAADDAAREFAAVFTSGGVPDDVPEHRFTGSMPLVHVLSGTGLAASRSEARRLVAQDAVSVDGEKVSDPYRELAGGRSYLLKVGKRRFARVTLD